MRIECPWCKSKLRPLFDMSGYSHGPLETGTTIHQARCGYCDGKIRKWGDGIMGVWERDAST